MTAPHWLTHFSLTDAPFSKELDDASLWVPTSRDRAVQSLVEASQEHGHAILTGEPGVGKTCVLRALRHRLPEAGFRLTYCHNATLGRRDFYRQLCLALGLVPKASAAAVFYEVTQNVRELGQANVHPVFLLDEAHLLHQDVLDHLHILSNYAWDSRALLSVVLVGLPELKDRMVLRRNRALDSRIHTRISLGDSSPEDTAEYVAHRLLLAGEKGQLFGPDALTLLHEASGGRLRDIDRIATNALKCASRRNARKVDRQIIGHVLDSDDND